MLSIFNLKAKKEVKAKKEETKKSTKPEVRVKLSRKETKELKERRKREYCGNDDDLGYC
ncbi:MAG: hypothetical protein HOP11_13685 [Saprospiraceae bacterium]|nr:hypothetical protein [Saprospiraceae bacterium]